MSVRQPTERVSPLRVGVVGAGGSGIVTAAALARAGLDFEVLEARTGVGGTWRYDPEGTGSACYASLVANTSKLRTSLRAGRISGRPWHYAAHTEMLRYLEDLVEREELGDRIRLDWRVVSAERGDGTWTVRNDDGDERTYDALVCALGVNGRPRWAALPGTFGGEQLHSSSYRTPERFAGRDVLVIGLGTSGCEVAGELAGHARSVHVAVRSPMWMMTRRLAGFPIDWLDNPAVARVVPWAVRRRVLAALCALTTGRLHRRGVPRPSRRCGDDVIAISDTFPRAVRRGLVEFHPAVDSVAGEEVRFADGTTARVDVIVHATGFEPPTDFLPADAQPHGTPLYRGIAHPGAAGLYFVGLFETHRALLPVAEAQAAWTAGVLARRIDLPEAGDQASIAAADAARRERDFGSRRPHLVDHAPYMARLRGDARRRRSGERPKHDPALG